MSYTVAEMLTLFQFDQSLSGNGVCRETGIKPKQLHIARKENILTKYINNKMIERFGPDWNSVENLRNYQRKKNIADNIDLERLVQLRQEKGYSLKDLGRVVGIGSARLAAIEKGTGEFYNWDEYEKCTQVLEDDLYGNSVGKSKSKTTRKEFITFKNVGGHWEMGKRVVQG